MKQQIMLQSFLLWSLFTVPLVQLLNLLAILCYVWKGTKVTVSGDILSIQLKGGTFYQLLDGYTLYWYTIIPASSNMEREWYSRIFVVTLETFTVCWNFWLISYFIMLRELRVLYVIRFWVIILIFNFVIGRMILLLDNS